MYDKKSNFNYKPLGLQSKPANKGPINNPNKNQTILKFKNYVDPESITLKEFIKLENKAYPDANFDFKFPPKKHQNLKASIKKSQYNFLGNNQQDNNLNNEEETYEAQTLKYVSKPKYEPSGYKKYGEYQNNYITKKNQQFEMVLLEKSIVQKLPQKNTFENLKKVPAQQNSFQKIDFETKKNNYQVPIVQTPKNDLIHKKKPSFPNFDEKNFNDPFSAFSKTKIKSEQTLSINQPLLNANYNYNEAKYTNKTENPIKKMTFNNPPPQKIE